MNQLFERLASNRDAVLSFPDGLSTPLAMALAELNSRDAEGNRSAASARLPLLGIPNTQWAFEIDQGAKIYQIRDSGQALIVLDDRGQVYRVNANTGKLIWKKSMGVPNQSASSSMSPLQDAPDAGVRKVRQLKTFGETFVLAFENELKAYSCEYGDLLWKAPLSEKRNGNLKPSNGATPSLEFDGEGNRVVLFDPLSNALVGIDASTGKWIWENTISSKTSKSDAYLVSTNTGISVRNGRVLVYGKESGIYDLETGELQWRFDGEDVRVFPVKLREQREDLSEEELVTLEQTKPKPVWTPAASNRKRQHMNYLSVSVDSDNDEIMSFVDYPGSLLAPAVDWANQRVVSGQAAHAVLSDEYLWLMDSRGVRLVSLNLPLASQQFELQGTFLGEFENHSWILGKNEVTHIDGSRGEMNSFPVRNLGGGLEGTLINGRVYVRGNGGVVVFNDISGKRISGANWDSAMIEYLSSLEGGGDRRYIWQGVVKTVAPGYPAYCHPMVDLVAGAKYYAVFEGNRIVAVSD
jgi:outer membrane protein assembly factor BamB